MKTIVCSDASCSVGGQSLFHNGVRKIFNPYYKKGDIIYLWGYSYTKLSESDFRIWNNNQKSGLGGTASELIADIVNDERNSAIEHLVVFTDRSLNAGGIDRSGSKMKNNNIHFEYVSTYIKDYGGYRSVGHLIADQIQI